MWVVPPNGGWHYIQNGVRIDGSDKASTVANIRAYRTANNLTLGNPEQDLDTFICTSWPNLCGGGTTRPLDPDEPPKAYGQVVKRRLVDRIASWAGTRYSKIGSISTVPAETAQFRANICVDCPANNTRWKIEATKDCSPCQERVEALESLLFKIRSGKSVLRENLLGGCETFGHCNRSAAWLTEDNLKHARHYIQDAPDQCWLTKS